MCSSMRLLVIAFISVVSSQRLKISPDKPVHHAELADSLYLECTAEVEDQTLVKDIKWSGPDGNQIVGHDRLTTEVLQGSGGGLGLYINNIEEGDSGNYKCTAVYAGNNQLSAETSLKPYQGIKFEDAPKEQHATLGGAGEITCKVVANPPANVDWFKDGVFVQATDRITIDPGKLRFTQTLTDDVGTYKCRAKVTQTGSLKMRLIKFDVFTPPEFTSDIEPVNAIEGQEVQIICNAQGHPKPKYLWKNPQNADLSTTDGYTVESNGKLIIHSVKREDKGSYTCTAENDAAAADISVQVTVVLKPKIEQYNNITVSVGETARIECHVSGDPLPEVSIRKASLEVPYEEGLQAENERVSYIVNEEAGTAVAVVEITSTERGDDGLYACQGKNVGGEVFQNGHIEVQFPPVFPEEQVSPMVWSWNNRIVNLSCIAEAIPNATITWTKRSKDLENDPHVSVHHHKGLSNLKVDPVDASYFGEYFCHAQNNILPTPEPRMVILKEAHVPGQIQQVVFAKTTATTITFTFRGPINTGGQDIDAYKVQYKEQGETWENAKLKSWPLEPYILENLLPRKTYDFRFAARNAVGYGEYTTKETKTMPEEGPPEEPEIATEGEAKDVVTVPFPDHYLLRWQVPANNGKAIQKYTINYYKINEETRKKAGDRVDIEVRHTQLTYDLTDLRADTFYKIELRAVNEIGNSKPSEITVKTAPDPNGDSTTGAATATSPTSAGTHAFIFLCFYLTLLSQH